MNAIVGYTGFVGSNLCRQTEFEAYYNSKNIETAYGTKPDILVYAGVRAEKHLANQFPERDKKLIEEAIENIKKIQPKQIILISTIDVYKNPIEVDEESIIDTENLHPYGYHRYLLEQWVRENIPKHVILRLPALFGKNIKKNFIYDFIQKIPSMLKKEKFEELQREIPQIINYYEKNENGFYHCTASTEKERSELRELLSHTGFSALNFTDSRAVFQFYDLGRLWNDIKVAIEEELSCINLATEPVSVKEIYHYLTGQEFVNEIAPYIPRYDFKSKFALEFGGTEGYLESKETVLKKIKEFVEHEISNL